LARPVFRVCSAVLVVCALAACAGRSGGSPLLPGEFTQFQRVQNVAGGSPDAAGPQVVSLGNGNAADSAVVLDLRVGADGGLYFTTEPAPAQGKPFPNAGQIGRLDFTTHKQTFRVEKYAPGFIEQTTGGVWVTEANNASAKPAIDRYTSIGGSDTRIAIGIVPFQPQPGGFNGLAGGIAIGADQQLWFGSNSTAQVGEVNPSGNAVKLYNLKPPGTSLPEPEYMILGSDQHVWVTDGNDDGVYRVASTGKSTGTSTFTRLPQGPSPTGGTFWIPQGVTEGSDSKIYTATLGVQEGTYAEISGAVNSAKTSAKPKFASIALASIGFEPYVMASGPGKVYFNDIKFDGLGIYDIASRSMVVLPLPTTAFGPIAVDPSGKPWISCITSTGAACVERVALTATWAVYPSTKFTLHLGTGATPPPALIGIGETGNSGPFTVKTSKSAVCTAAILSGFEHNIQVTPVAAGTCTLSIGDAHGRTVKVAVTVASGANVAHQSVRGLPLSH
jgi:streptogramin lyase